MNLTFVVIMLGLLVWTLWGVSMTLHWLKVRETKLQHSLLRVLLLTGPGSARELLERVEKSKRNDGLSTWNIYTVARRMERDGLLKSWESEPIPERGNRPRIYYKLTDRGARVAKAWR